VQLEAGQSQEIEFRKKGLKPGQYQLEVRLATTDALPTSDVRYATFEVRGSRKFLTIVEDDDQDYTYIWEIAFKAFERYECEVKTRSEIHTPDDLKPYQAVCLFSVREPGSLWSVLLSYVQDGGHLAIVPGREETVKEDYNSDDAQKLMPAKLDSIVTIPEENKLGVPWEVKTYTHPILAKFREWEKRGDVAFVEFHKPSVYKYWAVTTPHAANVIVRYAPITKKDDKDDGGKKDKKDANPALLERAEGRLKGRVVLFTTALDFRRDDKGAKGWNDYTSSLHYFYLVLANEVMGYLLGDMEDANFNFACGQILALPLPPQARFPEYTLDGPGVVGADTRVLREDKDLDLRIRQTGAPGNFIVAGGNAGWKSKFSLNPPNNEFVLDRVPQEEIEKVTGPESILAVDQKHSIKDISSGHFRQPMEWLPLLMLLLLIGLAVECYLANRFYKQEPAAEST
jgi:hypothetical protein